MRKILSSGPTTILKQYEPEIYGLESAILRKLNEQLDSPSASTLEFLLLDRENGVKCYVLKVGHSTRHYVAIPTNDDSLVYIDPNPTTRHNKTEYQADMRDSGKLRKVLAHPIYRQKLKQALGLSETNKENEGPIIVERREVPSQCSAEQSTLKKLQHLVKHKLNIDILTLQKRDEFPRRNIDDCLFRLYLQGQLTDNMLDSQPADLASWGVESTYLQNQIAHLLQSFQARRQEEAQDTEQDLINVSNQLSQDNLSWDEFIDLKKEFRESSWLSVYDELRNQGQVAAKFEERFSRFLQSEQSTTPAASPSYSTPTQPRRETKNRRSRQRRQQVQLASIPRVFIETPGERARKIESAARIIVVAIHNQSSLVSLSKKLDDNVWYIDINQIDANGKTFLMEAAAVGNVNIAKLLISRGAKLDMKDRLGNTALHEAVGFNRLEMVQLLLDEGASANPENIHRVTPLALAYSRGRSGIANALRMGGATPVSSEIVQWRRSINDAIKLGSMLYLESVLRDHPEFIDAKDPYGIPLIFMTLNERYEALIAVLQELGVNMKVRDRIRNTVLHVAAGKCTQETVRHLITRDTEIDAKNIYGNTPLMLALNHERIENAAELVVAGASVTVTNYSGISARDIADYKGVREELEVAVSKYEARKTRQQTRTRKNRGRKKR